MPKQLTDQIDRALSQPRREVLPLEYGVRQRRLPPIDRTGAIRQIIFATGVGFVVGGAVDIWANSFDAWHDNGIPWVAFGAGFIALVIPWPGRIGRKP